nr:hypothetical protein [uncultured Paracoccus sp.]
MLLDDKGLKFFESEIERRAKNREIIDSLIAYDPAFAKEPVVLRWQDESAPFGQPLPIQGEQLRVEERAADPAHVNDRLAFAKARRVKEALGDAIRVTVRSNRSAAV